MADTKESWKNNEEDEEEEEDLDETNYISQNNAVLFAIDVSHSMLQPPPPSGDKKAGTDSPTLAAIKCAYQIMQQRIISSPRDMMGVLLFGTEETKFQEDKTGESGGGLQYPHCFLLNELNIPAAEDVKTLKAIAEEAEEAEALLVPSSEPVSISNVLFCANQIFTTRAPNFGSRRLFIITDNDDPHGADKSLRLQAAVRAKDLYDLGVVIELFPISRPDHDFDRVKFYDDIVYRDPAEGSNLALAPTDFKASGDGISLLNSLISDINSKQVAKRTLFSNLPFEIGPDFKISVKGYNILQKQAPARSCYIWLGGETAQFPVSKSEKQEEDTSRVVQKLEVRKAYKFGGSHVSFTPEEQKELKNFGPPGLRIIGFKPQKLLPCWASIKKATFIYPSEEDYVGSTRVFSALWSKLLKDKIMGLAWYIARTNAAPIFVAILPSQERLDENTNTQTSPAGLWLYQIPVADDVRDLPDIPNLHVSPDELVDQMRTIVKQLQLPKAIYDPSKYPNPSLQWHYRILQAMALDEEVPKTADDKTIPKYRQIDKRAGEYINNWGKILDKHAQSYEAVRGIKREIEGGGDPPKKKARVKAEVLNSISTQELRNSLAAGGLGKHSVVELKEWLASKYLPVSGKKQDLLDRVEEWLDKN